MLALTRLLQLSDSVFPTGAYAFSDGLETYTQSKCVHDAISLSEILETQLRLGWGCCDAPACALSWDVQDLETINEMLTAIKIIEGPRTSSLRVGLALKRAARTVWPELELGLPVQAHHAVVFGVLARALEIPKREAITGFVSGWLLGKATSATRLFKLGGLEAQRIVSNLEPVILETIELALIAQPEDIQSFTPALDIAARAQFDLPVRLFQS
jgi:urease accessory protein